MKILLVEDERKLASLIKRGIEEESYEIDLAYDGLEGREMFFKGNYDLVILDINLPYLNGFELCKSIKYAIPKSIVMMLTALDSLDNKLNGFEMGADDYLVKPFEFKELMARIRALSKRRYAFTKESVLTYANLQLDRESKVAKRDNKIILLSIREFTLLEFLMLNKEVVVTKDDLFEKVWNFNFNTKTNVIEVYLHYLRKKIDKDFEPKLIHNIHGVGYIFKKEMDAHPE